MSFNTPILLIIFNRPETTAMVVDRIRHIKPQKLYVAADGPRKGKENEESLCKETRSIVVDSIDWDCEVHTLFRDENVGCGVGIQESLKWFFSNVEEGIILEDDCVPSLDFFYFSQKMLQLYRFEDRIKSISGTNYLFEKQKSLRDDYFFSPCPSVWGWATWRRVINEINWDYKYLMERNDPSVYLKTLKNNPKLAMRLHHMCEETLSGRLIAWDILFLLVTFYHNGLNIIATKNLVSNIGVTGTHYYEAEKDPALRQAIHPFDFSKLEFKKIQIDEKLNKMYLDGIQSTMVYDGRIIKRIKNRLIKAAKLFRNIFSF